MTIHKSTGTRFFISNDPLPENPTANDYKALEWIEVGSTTKPPEFESTYTPLTTKVIKRRGTYSYAIGKIKKPKRTKFGRKIFF